jgi:hypothetical protein
MLMRWCEFIAGFGSAVALPLVRGYVARALRGLGALGVELASRERGNPLAKATEYGLTASILTNNVRTAFSAARAVKSGYVWINGASGHFYGTPLGGFKNSGIRPAISGSNTRALGCP